MYKVKHAFMFGANTYHAGDIIPSENVTARMKELNLVQYEPDVQEVQEIQEAPKSKAKSKKKSKPKEILTEDSSSVDISISEE